MPLRLAGWRWSEEDDRVCFYVRLVARGEVAGKVEGMGKWV